MVVCVYFFIFLFYFFFCLQDEIERKGSILVDYKELLEDDALKASVSLSTELKEMPEKILDCMGLAIHQVCAKNLLTV